MVRKTEVNVVEHARGGEGSVEFHHIVSAEELNGHGSLYAMAILRPHSSVGWHQHVGNTEPYFILKGHGVFVDNDGTRTEIASASYGKLYVKHCNLKPILDAKQWIGIMMAQVKHR